MGGTKTTHQDPVMREHRRKFRIDGQAHTRMLTTALKVMEECEEPLAKALDMVGCTTPARTALEMRCALRLLVEGPAGELRGRLG